MGRRNPGHLTDGRDLIRRKAAASCILSLAARRIAVVPRGVAEAGCKEGETHSAAVTSALTTNKENGLNNKSGNRSE